MDLFKLFGSIFIKNDKANEDIDKTSKKAQNMADKVGSAFKTAGQKITNVGKALAPVSAGMATALGLSVKSASDFSNGMAKMSTLFDTQKVSVSNLSKEFINLSNKTGLASTELAEAGYQALSAGVNVNDAVKFVETAGNLAKAGFTSTSTAVDVLTTAMNAYGESAGTAEDISNKLVRTQNLGKTTVDELASAMGKVIPTASAMSVNIDNLTAGYVALTKQGIATAEATTYMNSMMNELGDSGTKLGEIVKEKTGKSFQDCMKSGMSLADVLKITKQYADENGIAYNELWSSAEAGKAGLSILNDTVEEFNNTVGIMSSKTDDVSEALTKLETPSMKVKKSMNQVKNAGIELGTTIMSALEPTLEKVTSCVEKATKWFSSLDEKSKTNIATFMAFGAVASPVLMIIGKLTSGVGFLVTKVGKSVGKFKLLVAETGSVGSALSSLVSPVGVVIGVIVALIAIFTTLYHTNEDFRNKVNQAWETIKVKISDVIEAVKQLIDSFIAVAKVAWDAWGQDIIKVVNIAFDYIATFIQNALDVVKNIINVVTAIIKGDWDSAWKGVLNILKSVFELIKNSTMNSVKLIMSIIKTGLKIICDVWLAIWNRILDGIRWVFESIKSYVSNGITYVKDFIKNGIESAKNFVSEKLDAIRDKFKNVFESAKNTVKSAIDKIKGFFNFKWSLPKLKMPHFKIKGKFGLNPPSVPKLSVQWYKKAMTEPYMFTKPTLFNVNPLTGQAKGAGEAGDEMMYGKKNLMQDIGFVVAQQNKGLIDCISDCFDKLFDILEMYFPEFTRTMVLDTGVLVAEIAEDMDEELGIIQRRKGR